MDAGGVFVLLFWVHVQSLVVEAANLTQPGCRSTTANSTTRIRTPQVEFRVTIDLNINDLNTQSQITLQLAVSVLHNSYLAARKLLVKMLSWHKITNKYQ